MKRIIVLAAFALLVTATQTTVAQSANAAPRGASFAPQSRTVAASAAAAYVASHPANVHASSGDTFVQHAVISTREGLQYVPYDRTYKGLPVSGGDFVVVTDANGKVLNTAVAQDRAINVATTPK
ncbi:MAG: M4 family peptidase, partial [Actinomycetota bacterium]|nr:M4 family peptidase [Actinomycetota bacterium]